MQLPEARLYHRKVYRTIQVFDLLSDIHTVVEARLLDTFVTFFTMAQQVVILSDYLSART